MAIYRQIHIDFWQDELVAEFSPEEKYFYIYLMTNNKTTQCGVYRVNLRLMAFDLGWDKTSVEKLLERFVEKGRVKFNPEHNELFMVNWLKYNSARSPKVASLIDKQIQEIKTDTYKQDVIRLCIQYGYPIKTVSQPEPEPEPELKPEPPPTPEVIPADKNVSSLLSFWEANGFGLISGHNTEVLMKELDIYGYDLLIKALEIAVEANKRNMKYVLGILKRWDQDGIDSIEKYNAHEKARSSKKQIQKPSSSLPTDWRDFKPTFE